MELLKHIDWNKVLFFDIETSSAQKELKETDEIYEMVKWKFRDKELGLPLSTQETINKYKKEAALHPELNKIVCIVVGVITPENTLRIKRLVGEEKDIISSFYTFCKGRILAGHNITGFDLPVIRFRAMANKVSIPSFIDDRGLKPWDIGLENNAKIKIIDSMTLNKGTYFYNTSLEGMCYILGVLSPKQDINGSMISEEYWTNGVERIAEYCVQDVLASANVILKMAGKETVELEDADNEQIEAPKLHERIFAAKEISAEDKEELRAMLSKKKLLKKDKERIEKWLLVLVDNRNGFIPDKDLPRKEEVIKEFVNSL